MNASLTLPRKTSNFTKNSISLGRLKLLTSLVLLLGIGITPVAWCQDFTYAGESVDATEIIITAIDEDMNTRVPAPSFGDALGLADAVSGAAEASVFEVTYINFTPEAQTAFQRAVDIASSLITSPVTIRVQSEFRPLGSRVLGNARVNYIHRLESPAWSEGFWYPDALADKLLRRDLSQGAPDIYASFNNRAELWYFGLDGNTPAGKYDFVTIVLHELVHGLGFTGQGSPVWLFPSRGTVRNGAQPGIYDFFVVEGATTPIGNTLLQQKLITKYVDPSVELLTALTGGNLYWAGAQGVANNGGNRPKLYAPNPWNLGSSYSHLDEATYPAGDPNSLMTPRFGSAESIHDPGDIMRGIFDDIGWGNFPAAPTVALTGPTGTQPGGFNVTVTFSESVNGFDAADVTLTPSFTHGTGDPTFSVSGSGTTYTVSVTPAANTAGNVVVSVRKNAATAGTTVMPVPALPQQSWQIAFDTRPADTVAPTVVIGGPGRANAPFDVTFDFSEALGPGAGGFTMADISANWEASSTNTVPTSSINVGEPSQTEAAAHLYTATITPAAGAADGDITVALHAGSVQDTANNPIAAAGIKTTTVTYDTTAPTVTVVRPQVYDNDGNLVPQTATAGHPFTVNVTFSEPVTGFETSDITVSNATVTSLGGSDESYIVTITPSSSLSAASIVVTVTPAGVNDLAGNTGTATGSTTSVTVSFADKIRPTITAVTTVNEYVRGPFDVTFDFSEPLLEVEGERNEYEFLKEDVQAFYSDKGTPRPSVPNDPVVDGTDRSRYTVRIVPPRNGQIRVQTTRHSRILSDRRSFILPGVDSYSKIKDRSGNLLQVNNTPAEYIWVTYDTVAPTVQASLASGRTEVYGDFRIFYHFIDLNSSGEVAYARGVDSSSFTAADITITGTGSATVLSGPTRSPDAAFMKYYVTIRPSAEGELTVTLNSESVTDEAGNALADSGSTRAVTVTYVDRPPRLEGLSIVSRYPWNSATNRDFEVLVSFSEPVDGSTFTADDITITDGTGSATLQGSPYLNDQRYPSRTFYLLPIRPTAEGTFTVTLSGSVTGLDGAALTSYRPPLTVTYDTTRPTVTLSAPAMATGPYDVTFTFSERIIRETLYESQRNQAGKLILLRHAKPRLTLTGAGSRDATVGEAAPPDSDGTVYRVKITPAADANGDITVTLPSDSFVRDLASNPLATTGNVLSVTTRIAGTPSPRPRDTTPPTVVVTSGLNVNKAFVVNFDFSEELATSGNGAFTASDINVTPTTATVTSGPTQDTTDASRYTATITPTVDGQVTVSLTTAGVEDAAGNAVTSTGSLTSTTVLYDATPPTVVVSRNSGLTTPVNKAFVVNLIFRRNWRLQGMARSQLRMSASHPLPPP